MNGVSPQLIALAGDAALSAGFGFVVGAAWQLALAPFYRCRQIWPLCAATAVFAAPAAGAAFYFTLGMTSTKAVRWYIVLGMCAGAVLWRLLGWRLMHAVWALIKRCARGAALAIKSAALLPLRAAQKARERAAKHLKKKKG